MNDLCKQKETRESKNHVMLGPLAYEPSHVCLYIIGIIVIRVTFYQL